VEHTRIYKDTGVKLKQIAVDAAFMIKNKKKILNEALIPEIDKRLEEEFRKRLPNITNRLDEFEKKNISRSTVSKMPIVVRPKLKSVPINGTIDDETKDGDDTHIQVNTGKPTPDVFTA
jgi:hypothetical protein